LHASTPQNGGAQYGLEKRSLGSRLVHSVCRLGERKGLFTLVRSRIGPAISGKHAWVVTFHDIRSKENELSYSVTQDVFEETIRYFTRNFNVVPLREIVDAVWGKERFEAPTLAVTFDDGRRSFLTHGLPVLREYGVSATVFLISKTLDPSFVVWTDTVEQLVYRLETVRVPRYLGYVTSIDSSSFALKRAAVVTLKAHLRYLPVRRREVAVRELLRVNGLTGEELHTGRLYLKMEDIPQLVKAEVEIGSHSHTHEVFSLLSREEARRELITSKRVLEDVSGRPVVFFAFPCGTRGDFRPQDVSLAREAGYRAALTTVRGAVGLKRGQFLLPRMEAPGGYEEQPLSLFSGLSAYESLMCGRRQKTLKPLLDEQKRTNVLYVIDCLHTEYAGGTETQLETTIRNADRDFVNPFLILLRGIPPTGFKCPVDVLGVDKLLGLGFIVALYRLSMLMRREKIDVAHLLFFDSIILGTVAARLAGVPVIISSRRGIGSLTVKKSEMLLVRALNRLTTCILSNAHAVRDSVLQDEEIPFRKAVVLHNGMVVPQGMAMPPGEAKLRLGLKPREMSVGIVSNLRHVKGVDVFLRAAAEISKQEPLAHFSIFGEGELRGQLEALARELGIEQAVDFLGFRRDVYSLIPGFDVAVISSRSEGCANALLEYCFAGSAVVATDVGGNAEIIANEESGILVPSDDPVSLGNAVVSLLQASHRRTVLGAQARRDANEKFILRDALRQLWCLYWRLLHPEDAPEPVSTDERTA
jgi:glycosyltransferase involved in cell wall biosynthesis/peptidoglycan/xylan/chitin deacetylase (PgdA/CDA1 family)